MKSHFAARFLPSAALTLVVLAFTGCAKQAEAPKTTASAAPAARTPAAPAAALPILGPAPQWSLKDVHGQPINSDQFKGKIVVVDFWATWCVPCRSEIPGYVDLQRKYGKDGLVIVGVSLDSDEHPADTVAGFVKKFAVNYQVVLGDENVQTAFGGLDAIPTTFLIDRVGRIRDKKMGAEPTEEYEKKIAALLEEPAAEKKAAAAMN